MDKLCIGFDLFKKATCMVINLDKSYITCSNLEAMKIDYFSSKFACIVLDIDEGFNYMGFYLNPNDYQKSN